MNPTVGLLFYLSLFFHFKNSKPHQRQVHGELAVDLVWIGMYTQMFLYDINFFICNGTLGLAAF